MTKSSLGDLNSHLFAALNRLSVDTLSPDEIETECKRAEAVVAVADQITNNAKTQLAAAKLYAEHGQAILPHLPLIGKGAE